MNSADGQASSAAADHIDTNAPNSDSWSVTYSDHSGNVYRFWKTGTEEGARFSYEPIQPETSSSGIYSGGSPRQGMLDTNAIATLFAWIRELGAATSSHCQERRKGTGSFRIREGDEIPRRFLIAAGARRQAFDEFIAPYR
jgi:hypothetical protein